MRQQYHIRQVGEDTHVWDVNRLLRLHANVPTQAVALSQIAEIQQAYWFPNTHPSTADIVEHMRLVEAADLAYPILMDAEGKLMDGMHRVAKALLAGHSHIHAQLLPQTPAPDFINVDVDSLPYDDSPISDL
ncbi:MAG: hypothetical protein KBE67_08055 [Vitreoscilla sp.]|nr:hypothetical protein [Vitreoscilla sp.]